MALIFKSPSKMFIAVCCLSAAACQLSCTQSSSSEAEKHMTEQTPNAFQVKHVDASEAYALLNASSDFVVLDIRAPKEIKDGYIEGAVFADFFAKNFEEKLSLLDRNTPYIIHCGSGGRSTKALTTLEALGFTNITHMDGGMQDWVKAELPLRQP